MATAFNQRLSEGKAIFPEPPRPLRRPMREAEPYPIDALEGIVGNAVKATHALIQAPMEICAQSALAQASLAVQAHADIVLPTGQSRPVSLFLMSVASSGDRKSAADRELGWALEKRERALSDELVGARADYRNEKEAWDAARAKAKTGKDNDRRQMADALNALGAEPQPPLDAVLSFPEPTLEGLHKYLAVGQPSMGLFSDEGGMFVGGVGMTKENALKTGAGMSHLWDGAPIKRLRSLDGATVLFGRRVSVHLMIQPDAAQSWLADPVLKDQGLFSRLLVTAPRSLAGSRLSRLPHPDDRAAVNRFGGRCLSWLERPYETREGKPGELVPRDLRLTNDAENMWRGFVDAIEGELGESGKLAPVRGLANKTPEHAARLAAVLALFDDLDVAEITSAMLARGITLANWYLAEALRLAEVGYISEDVRLAEQLLRWLHDTWPSIDSGNGATVSAPDIYQRGPGTIREKAVAMRAVTVLVDHGWLIRIEGGASVNGVQRREAYGVRRA